MRATGIMARAGLSGSGISGPATSTRGTPIPLDEPWPNAKPPPGRPMPPSIAASTMAAQYGCAPRKFADGVGGNAGDGLGPLRILRDIVVESQKIAAERFEAGAIARDE